MKDYFYYTKKVEPGRLEVRKWAHPLAGWASYCHHLALHTEPDGTARLTAGCHQIRWTLHGSSLGYYSHGEVSLSKGETDKIPVGQSADRLFKTLTRIAREKNLAICWK
jgi:hypothetical protein